MTILIIEDEPSIREVETAYLTQAGYEVVEAADGRTAIKVLEERTFDLVIVDLSLPHVSGLDVCRTIRETSSVPILIVTARNSDEDEIKGFEIGADDYIKKPFNPNVLVARTQALLRHRQSSKQLHFQGLTIDPGTMTVTKDGQPITLTTTRFNLLLALASQPNIVFSRMQLVNQIYNDPSTHIVYDRTIDAHIKALRQQIETDPHNPAYIETVIGSGYRFRLAT
jgi:DNA-binding response OmpR family regulator